MKMISMLQVISTTPDESGDTDNPDDVNHSRGTDDLDDSNSSYGSKTDSECDSDDEENQETKATKTIADLMTTSLS